MSNRVLLNSSGLKVSKPGVDVLTAGSTGLQFSSDWSGMPIAERGTVTLNWTTLSSTEATSARTITLAKTYSSVPYTLFFWIIAGVRVGIGMGDGFIYQLDRNEGGGAYNSRFGIYARVYTTKIEFLAAYRKKTSGVVTPDAPQLEYIVFDNNL